MFRRGRKRPEPDRAEVQFDEILTLLRGMLKVMSKIDDAITQLQGDVTKLTSVNQSAITLITGFQAQLAAAVQAALDAGATPAELQSLTDLHTAISAQSDSLAAAVAANTPAPAPAPAGA